MRPSEYGEHHFNYLNLSARSEANDIRNFLQDAFNQYPDDESVELKKRIQCAKISHSNSAIFELILHELLCQLSFKVTVHPKIRSSDKKPDFLVTGKNGLSLYIEAICTSELNEEKSTLERQKNKLFNEINNEFKNQYASLSISIIRQSKENFQRKELFHSIRTNLKTLQNEETLSRKWEWVSKAHDWRIELQLKKLETVSRQFISCIYPYIARPIDIPSVVKKAFKKKSTRYGELDFPYVLAINIDTSSLDDIDEMESLFGKELFTISKDKLKFAGLQKNGAWYGPHGPENTRVSGAWIFHELSAWRLNKRHFLYLNPFAVKPINQDFYSLLPYVHILEMIERRPGKQISELLGINWDWIKE